MAKIFYSHEARLIVADEDACAIWQGGGWIAGTIELAREVWITEKSISQQEAAIRFPDADLKSMPI